MMDYFRIFGGSVRRFRYEVGTGVLVWIVCEERVEAFEGEKVVLMLKLYEGGDVSRVLGLVPSRSAKIDVRLIPEFEAEAKH